MTDRILYRDKDIRMGIFFLTNLATILERMQRDLANKNTNMTADWTYYEKKMDEYEKVFDTVAERDFNNDMFGEYANSVSHSFFQRQLTSDGWKYFDLKNLNELFEIRYIELIKAGELHGAVQVSKVQMPLTEKSQTIGSSRSYT